MGCSFAIRKLCADRIKYPAKIVADDHYTYFWMIKNGWKFIYVPNAVAGFKVPSSVSEFLQQKARYTHSQSQISEQFVELESNEYHIPLSLKLKAYWQTFRQNPIYLVSAVILNVVAIITTHTVYRNIDKPFWKSVSTTK